MVLVIDKKTLEPRLFSTVSRVCANYPRFSKKYMYNTGIGNKYELREYKGYLITKINKE